MNVESIIATVILLAVLPVTIIVIWFFVQKHRHKERMALIDKGINIIATERKDTPFQDILMWGMLASGIGIGLLIAYILLQKNVLKDDMILGILAILFGGIGLISYYLIKKKHNRKLI